MSEVTAVLLGCVSQKRDSPAPAKDLYRSQLWRRRRAYAEASGRPWMILSALHGLVDPEALLELRETLEVAEHRVAQDQQAPAFADQLQRPSGGALLILVEASKHADKYPA